MELKVHAARRRKMHANERERERCLNANEIEARARARSCAGKIALCPVNCTADQKVFIGL